MKHLFLLLYIIITWGVKIIVNIFEFFWHFDFKHLSIYRDFFYKISDIKEIKEFEKKGTYSFYDEFNLFEKIVYKII